MRGQQDSSGQKAKINCMEVLRAKSGKAQVLNIYIYRYSTLHAYG